MDKIQSIRSIQYKWSNLVRVENEGSFVTGTESWLLVRRWQKGSMQFAGTVLYVDDVQAAVDFYCRAFGLEVRFADDSLGFAELETGGSMIAIAWHSLGRTLMPT